MPETTGATTPTLNPEAAARTDRLELLQQLSGGTIGVVHKARNPKQNRTVALRQLQVPEWLDDGDQLIKRILAEARAASALDHPNIARLYTGGYKGFTVFLTSEFVEGINVRDFAASRNLGMPELRVLAKQLCSALDYAHQKNVLHHSLSPANLQVLPDGTLKVLDFGLIRDKELYSPTPAKRLESEHYLSPEQLKNKPLTPVANVFTAATILYELFTTRNPFAGKHLGEVDRNISDVDPTPASQAHPRVPDSVSKVLLKALAKTPIARYQSCAELTAALEEAFSASPAKGAPAQPPKPPAPKPAVAQTPAQKPIAPAAPVNGKPVSAVIATPESNGNNHQPQAAAPAKSPSTAVRPQTTAPARSKMAPNMLKQWKLIGIGIAGLFVVSALAISLNHRNKIPAAAPAEAVRLPEQAPVEPESTASEPLGSEPIIDIREIKPKTNTRKAARNEAPVPVALVEGQLAISSQPDGASIAIEGQAGGPWKTPQVLASLTPGVYRVTLSKSGYATETRSIEVSGGNRTSLDVKLTALKGFLTVSGTPTGAAISIDGRPSGKASPAEFALEPATHTISLHKEGYFDTTTEIRLSPGQAMTYSPTLKAAGRTDNIKVVGGLKKLFGGGSSESMSLVEIKTDPKGAQVTINGNTLSKSTPFEIQVEPGNYEITIRKDGYKLIHKSLTTQANQKLRIDEQLTK